MKYSELRSSQRIDLCKEIPLDIPLTLYIELTNICNFRCHFCPESFTDFHKISGGKFKLDYSIYSEVINELSENGGIKTLNFYMMGEPFVNKEITKFISYAKQKSVAEKLIVTTNGSLIKENIYESICTSLLDYLRVSIYGFNEENQNQKSIMKQR